MKKIVSLLGLIAILATFSSCRTAAYTQNDGDAGYAYLMFTDASVRNIIAVIDGQEFKTKTENREEHLNRANVNYTTKNCVRVSIGVHSVQVMTTPKREVIYNRKVVVTNSETKNIQL